MIACRVVAAFGLALVMFSGSLIAQSASGGVPPARPPERWHFIPPPAPDPHAAARPEDHRARSPAMSVIDIMLIVLAIGTLVGVQVRNGRATVTARSKVIWSLGGWVIVLLVVVAIWVIAAVRF